MGNSSPLRKTIRERDLEGMKSMLDEAGEGSPDIINEDFTGDCVIQRSRNIQSPLHTCVGQNKIEMVETLLLYGADVNMGGRNGMTPLHYAAKNGRVEMCKLLVKHGADNSLTDNMGERPIHSAAVAPYTENKQLSDVLEYLVKDIGSPEDVNTVNGDGKTPLILATSWGYIFIAKWLLDNGADKNIEDNLGKKAIDWARGKRREQMLEYLSE